LNGAGGNDTIQGAGGNDVMIGGTGNDTYFLEDSGDTITESADEGSDAVIVFTSSYTLAANVEVGARFLTTAYALTGNALDNQLYGNNGDDTLNGGDGNDTLQGGGGNDIMVGGAGDDTYFVEQAGDGVTENSNEGNDAAIVLIGSYTLAANVEVGATFLTSGVSITGNGLDNQLYGNAGADTLSGAAGADLLDGGAGADMLTGGSENDVFVFVAGQGNGDTVTDFAGNGASAGDTLRFSGYGTVGASFVQLDSTHWQINSADGTIHDTITLANGAGVDASDWMFV
jgi:serralysin